MFPYVQDISLIFSRLSRDNSHPKVPTFSYNLPGMPADESCIRVAVVPPCSMSKSK